MNQGCPFFSINSVAKPRPDDTTDLTFIVSEGRQAQLNTIMVTGNQKVPTTDIICLISLHSDNLFNRAKLIESQRTLAQSGKFNPAKIGINPQPVPRPSDATDLVNIAFAVEEK